MVTYSLAQVVALTGISAHSLRIWERRFDFIKPNRTATNLRYYTDDQLKMLINVGILLRNNHKISKIAAMDQDEMHQLVKDIILDSGNENGEDIKALTLCMINMDESGFDELYQFYIEKYGVLQTYIQLIYPFLHHVGVLWGSNKAMPAQEHFISNLIRQKLILATDKLPEPEPDAPRILLFLFAGEDHEIGLLLANYMAKEQGWRTFYLGQNVPSDNIQNVVDIVGPALMFTMMVTPRRPKFQEMLSTLLNKLKVPLLYSGKSEWLESKVYQNKAHYLPNPDTLIDFLNDHVTARRSKQAG